MHCGNQEYKVHKLVICGQSKVFSRMFNGNWKVGFSLLQDLLVAKS